MRASKIRPSNLVSILIGTTFTSMAKLFHPLRTVLFLMPSSHDAMRFLSMRRISANKLIFKIRMQK